MYFLLSILEADINLKAIVDICKFSLIPDKADRLYTTLNTIHFNQLLRCVAFKNCKLTVQSPSSSPPKNKTKKQQKNTGTFKI